MPTTPDHDIILPGRLARFLSDNLAVWIATAEGEDFIDPDDYAPTLHEIEDTVDAALAAPAPALLPVEALSAVAGLNPSVWADIGPHLSCQEAETFAALLTALRHPALAEILLDNHTNGDDPDEGDVHYFGDDGTRRYRWDAGHDWTDRG